MAYGNFVDKEAPHLRPRVRDIIKGHQHEVNKAFVLSTINSPVVTSAGRLALESPGYIMPVDEALAYACEDRFPRTEFEITDEMAHMIPGDEGPYQKHPPLSPESQRAITALAQGEQL